MVQYFWSYREEALAQQLSQTGPRLIYIRKLPGIKGWAKADLKTVIDHLADEEFSATFEAQLGHMVSPGWGVYAEALVGDSVVDTDAYDWGLCVGIRVMY